MLKNIYKNNKTNDDSIPAEVPDFESYIEQISLDKLKQYALSYSNNEIPEDILIAYRNEKDEITKKANAINGWLRFIQSNESLSRMRWSYFVKESNEKKLYNRDKYISNFFNSISKFELDKNLTFPDYVKNNWCPWAYYQNHFFDWFLDRFNLIYACRVFSKYWIIQNFHWLLLPILSLVSVISYYIYFNKLSYGYSAILGIIVFQFFLFYLLARFFSNLDFIQLIHSMVPRLMATISIGYLFLLSVPDFVRIIYNNQLNTGFQSIACVLLIISVITFLMLHIHRRVKPELSFSQTLTRALNLLAISISYATIGLLIFEKIIFMVANNDGSLSPYQPCFTQLLFLSTVSLTIGVILQLIWEEKPVTEPL